jgi:hypothetical protein
MRSRPGQSGSGAKGKVRFLREDDAHHWLAGPKYIIVHQNVRRSHSRHCPAASRSAPSFAFSRHGGMVWVGHCQSRDAAGAPPAGRPRAWAKERAGRNTSFSSSAMISGRLFLDRVGRHQSPSPLYRRTQHSMRSPRTPVKPNISTLPERGHFCYFALTASRSR